MTRRELREHIFLLVFRLEFHTYEEMPEQVRLYFEELEEPTELSDEEYIENKTKAIFERLTEIDDDINSRAEKWNTERMGKVELSIIRLAVYEILFDDDVPAAVAIDEAVELSKKYGQEDSGAFVNGVLSKFVKE